METIKVLFTSSMSIYCTFCQLIRELTTVFFIQDEWRYLLSGGTVVPKQIDNPAPDWLSDRAWSEVLTLSALVSKTHLYTRGMFTLQIIGSGSIIVWGSTTWVFWGGGGGGGRKISKKQFL